jgi:Na+-transporting NADH:ubiquinone oxidoreductase subunit NqrE
LPEQGLSSKQPIDQMFYQHTIKNKAFPAVIPLSFLPSFLSFVVSFFAVLEFELRDYTLSHSTSPFL